MRFISIGLFLLGLLTAPLSALYNGNPSFPMMPENGCFIPKDCWFGLKTGYAYNAVYDQKLRYVGHGSSHLHRDSHISSLVTQLGVLTFNFFSRVEVYTVLGTLSSRISQHPAHGYRVSYHFDPQFTWGVGGNAILAYWGDIQLGVNASYLSANSDLSSLKINGHSARKNDAELFFRQWQVGASASYRWKWLIPYIGVDYLDFRARIDYLKNLPAVFTRHHVTFKDAYPMGLYLGLGISPDKGANLNVEARFFNENAFSTSVAIRF